MHFFRLIYLTDKILPSKFTELTSLPRTINNIFCYDRFNIYCLSWKTVPDGGGCFLKGMGPDTYVGKQIQKCRKHLPWNTSIYLCIPPSLFRFHRAMVDSSFRAHNNYRDDLSDAMNSMVSSRVTFGLHLE